MERVAHVADVRPPTGQRDDLILDRDRGELELFPPAGLDEHSGEIVLVEPERFAEMIVRENSWRYHGACMTERQSRASLPESSLK